MTNEVLAEFIQQGDNDELLPVLWEKVQTLLFIKAERYYYAFSDTLCRYGYEVQDIKQECYSAMLAAVRWYNPDKGYKFTTYLNYALKHIIRGLYSGKNDALNHAATMSLEQPIGTDKDGAELTLADTMADDTAAQAFEDIENNAYYSTLYNAIETLPEDQRQVIQAIYFDGCKLAQTAERLKLTPAIVRKLEGKALRHFRSGKIGVQLRRVYGDEYAPRRGLYTYGYHKGIEAFASSRSSSVEDAALLNLIYSKY